MSHIRQADRVNAHRASLFQRGEVGLNAQRRAVSHNADALENFSDGIRDMSDYALIVATETYFEAALVGNSDDQILRCLEKGVKRTDGVLEKDEGFGIKTEDYLRAHVLRAYAPFFGSLSLEKRLPNPKIAMGIYDRLVRCAEVVTANWDDYDVQAQMKQKESRISGAASQLFGLLLFQRFATKDMTDRSWHPAPTMFRDGKAGTSGSATNRNWDISCYTQLEPTADPSLAYKVKIKATQRAINRAKRSYAEDIKVIPIRERVLNTGGHAPWHLKDALTLLVDEHRGATEDYRPHPTEILKKMTGNILDAIDE